jgi:hypothetical protein
MDLFSQMAFFLIVSRKSPVIVHKFQ